MHSLYDRLEIKVLLINSSSALLGEIIRTKEKTPPLKR